MIPALSLVSGIIQLAPAIAGLFGKGEKEAQIVAGLAAKVTGQDQPDAILASLKDQPQYLLELQKLLVEEKQTYEQQYVNDKESARRRDVQFLKSGTRNYRGDFLVGISVVVVFTILGIVILQPDVSEFAKGALTTILGVFLNQLTNVFAFEFGTTRKEEDKQGKIFDDYMKS